MIAYWLSSRTALHDGCCALVIVSLFKFWFHICWTSQFVTVGKWFIILGLKKKKVWKESMELCVQKFVRFMLASLSDLLDFCLKKESTRRLSNKSTKTLYRDYLLCISNLCETVFNIFCKEIISINTKCRNQILKYIWNTWNFTEFHGGLKFFSRILTRKYFL